jgi:hypothetical protein
VITQSLSDELEQVFNHFPNYYMIIILGDCTEKLGREDIFRPTMGNERLYQDTNNNNVIIVNFTTSII